MSIQGVVIQELKTFPDERGFFREVVRFDDIGFVPKQWSHSLKVHGVSNGWHIHRYHSELFYVSRGVVRICMRDCRNGEGVVVGFPYDGIEKQHVNFGESATPNEYQEVVLGEYHPLVVMAPAGVAHAYRVLGGPADITYVATETYEKTRHDEGRIEAYRWGSYWSREIEIR